jgi:hypothetical protein
MLGVQREATTHNPQPTKPPATKERRHCSIFSRTTLVQKDTSYVVILTRMTRSDDSDEKNAKMAELHTK